MDEKLNIALIQSPLVWENPIKNRANFTQILDSISEEVDMVILPEMFTTGFTMTPRNVDKIEGKKTVEWMKKMARTKDIALIGSVPFYENGSFFNRLFFVKPEGEVLQYDKRHTFTLAGEDKVYKAGIEILIVDYKGFKICPMICYDLRFPVWSRNTENYDILLYVANWPKQRVSAWDALLKARAIENMTYCIGVNRVGADDAGYEYCGHSAVYDGLGERLAFSDGESVLCTTLNKSHIVLIREKLKFLDDRDEFNLLG